MAEVRHPALTRTPNVVRLFEEDREPVQNIKRRGGANPRGVIPLRKAYWRRIRPLVFAYLWNKCLPENRGALVLVLRQAERSSNGIPLWRVRGVGAQLTLSDGESKSLHDEGDVPEENLRRCRAPDGWEAQLLELRERAALAARQESQVKTRLTPKQIAAIELSERVARLVHAHGPEVVVKHLDAFRAPGSRRSQVEHLQLAWAAPSGACR